MSFGSSSLRGRASAGLLVALSVFLVSSPLLAQSDSNPKWDLFVGYQWLHPGGTVPGQPADPSNPTPFTLPDMAKGFGTSLTYNFDKHVGMEADFGHNWRDGNYELTGSIGPRFMWRTDDANFFVHTQISLNRLSVNGLNSQNGIGAILGGGMELPLTKHLAFRVFEADYVWARHNYADFASSEFPDLRRPAFEGVRLRTGLVFNWGGAPAVTPAVACSVQPAEVMVGEPIAATATASNFPPKHTLAYSWSGNGGLVVGKDATATIDTKDATPGTYAVTAHVTDAKVKKNNEASCTANYTIKPLPPKNPPTMSISADPSTVQQGVPVTLHANCTSPDGVPVSVANWQASGGSISGSGDTATLTTAGASPGTITVNASCSDNRGLNAQASTQVSVQNPPPPQVNPELEADLKLGHSIYFQTAKPTEQEPRGGLLPTQQEKLLKLATNFKTYLVSKPDAHLVLEAHADIRGTDAYNQALTERRAAGVKAYLVDNGVPENTVETVGYGKQRNLTLEEVKDAIEKNTDLTPEERRRALRNIMVIKLASNRRVDIVLKSAGGEAAETSVKQFPFNSSDALSLIGGRESEMKKAPAKKGTGKTGTRKKPAKSQ
jgi:outer membrane protein OmpA-like peptidoglycan-associated protein